MSEVTILVPGFLDRVDYLEPLAAFLQSRGIAAQCITPQPTNGYTPIEALAAQLAARIDALYPAEQALNLVGFSMGGLICRTYVQQLGGHARVQRLITLATPHRGTYTSYLFQRPATIQMRPNSSFLAVLNRDLATLAAIAFTSIWTPLDLTIVPANSSRLPVGKMEPILSPFHAWLPFDPRVQRAVAASLSA